MPLTYSASQLSFQTLRYVYMYTTPTFVTEALHLATACTVFNNCYSELTPYTALALSYQISFHNAYQCQGTAHNDTNYSCHITAVELV